MSPRCILPVRPQFKAVDHPSYFKGLDYIYEARGEVRRAPPVPAVNHSRHCAQKVLLGQRKGTVASALLLPLASDLVRAGGSFGRILSKCSGTVCLCFTPPSCCHHWSLL